MAASACNNTNPTASKTVTTAAVTTTTPPTFGTDSSSPNTTFVQTDPSTFRTIVQKLTGAPDDPSTQKLHITHPTRPATSLASKRPSFKLQDRRPSAKNLQINLNNNNRNNNVSNHHHHDHFFIRQRGFLVSPVSPLDFFAGRVSPRSPCEEFSGRGSPREVVAEEEEETKAIAEKGFYLHPSPLSTPRGAEPPELLPLFPFRSPTDSNINGHDSDN